MTRAVFQVSQRRGEGWTPLGTVPASSQAAANAAARDRWSSTTLTVQTGPVAALELAEQVTGVLSDDLRKPKYRGNPNRLTGHCYVATESLYHLLGGAESGATPMNLQHEGDQHWFLRLEDGSLVDPTAGQFRTPVPYDQARGRGFLTKKPSKRAAEVIRRVKQGSGEKLPSLSPTQDAAIRAIVAAYDTAVARERELWGEKSAAAVAAKGIDTAQIVKRHKTVHALEALHLITRKSHVQTFGERLRKGPWGRRLGGTVTDRYVQHMVVPTALARAYVETQAGRGDRS